MNTYEEIAIQHGLDEGTTGRYLTYMRLRWSEKEAIHCQVGYASKWAERFKAGREFCASDPVGQSILRKMPL